MAKPKLIVFDLDYTLWPFWVDTVNVPFHLRDGKVYDSSNYTIDYYPEVPQILERLKAEGYTLAVASRTGEIRGAEQLLKLFDWNKYFTYQEIYPGCKKTHFRKYHKDSGIPFKDMLFFDDENRNIIDLNSIGVTSILVDNGMTSQILEEGLAAFKNKR